MFQLVVKTSKKQARGKKTRKHGRNKRKPCKVKYTNAKVWELNKVRKAQKTANSQHSPVRVKVAGEWAEVKNTKVRKQATKVA